MGEDAGVYLKALADLRSIRECISVDGGGEWHRLQQVVENAESELKLKAEAMLSTAVHGAAPLPPLAAYSFGADPRSAIPPQQLPALQLPATRTRTAGDPTRHASLNNPASEGNRQYLAQRLGIQPSALSSAARPVGQRATVGKLNKVLHDPPPSEARSTTYRSVYCVHRSQKKMASTKGVIERSARRDLHATPPIGPKDVAAGLFSLVNRGLVAAHVDLTPVRPP